MGLRRFTGLAKRLLILGPSFRRNSSGGVLPAIERYDGLFFRVSRKYLAGLRDVGVLVMTDELILVNAKTPLPYTLPKGTEWGSRSILEDVTKKAREENEVVLNKKLRSGVYSEVFIAMGKEYAKGLPDLSKYDLKVIFPTHGGPGPKAQALKAWLSKG